jgi:hypothetical protein
MAIETSLITKRASSIGVVSLHAKVSWAGTPPEICQAVVPLRFSRAAHPSTKSAAFEAMLAAWKIARASLRSTVSHAPM